MEIDLGLVVDTLPGLAWTALPDGHAEYVGKQWREYTGLTLESTVGAGWLEAVHPDDRQRLISAWTDIIASGRLGEVEARLHRHDGVYRWFLFRACPMPAPSGEVTRWFGLNVDIDDRMRAEEAVHQIELWYTTSSEVEDAKLAAATLAAEKHLLERVAKGVALPLVLDELARAVESIVPGCRCTIAIVDESGQRFKFGAAPTLPAQFKMIMDGRDIDPSFGPLSSCVVEKAPIIIGDVENDARWAASAWPAMMKARNLRSNWSAPILAADGAALAAFSIFRREPQVPTPRELELIDRFTHIAGIAIERAQTDAALKTSEDKLAAEKRLLQMVATGMPLRDVLEALCREVETLTPAALCGVLFVGPDRRHFVFGAGPSIPVGYRESTDGNPIDPTHGPCALAVTLKAPVISANIAEDPRWVSSPLLPVAAANGLVACWSIPIFNSGGDAAGAFAVYRREPTSAKPDDLELIDRFVHIAGIAMGRAQADAALKASEHKLASEKHLLQLVAKGVPLSEVLDAVCRQVDAFASGSVCAITVTDPDHNIFGPSTTPGMPEGYKPLIEGKAIEQGYGPSAFAVANRTTVVAADLVNDPRWAQSIVPGALEKLGILSCWATPIMSAGGIPLGALAAYCRERRSPNEGEVELIERFAHIAGIAIEREHAEAALTESEAELRRANQYLTLAQELSQIGSHAQDLTSGERTLSEEMYRILEFDPRKPVTSEMVRSRIHPDDLAAADAIQDPALAAGKDYGATFRIVMPSGVVKHVRSVNRRLTDIPDRLVYVGATQDVTDWKLAEEALQASRAELLQAHAHLNEAQRLSRTGSFTWDVERDEHNWSGEVRRIWEFSLDATITMTMILEAIHPDDMPLAEQVIGNAPHEQSFEVVLRIITKGGLLKHVHIVGRRVEDIDDRIVFLGAIQDITERKTSEEALNRARAELAHVSRAMTLSALTASIAHEVNQPLAGIITNANTGLRMLAANPPNLQGLRAAMQRTLRDGNRASEVIQRLRAMFARQSPGLECVDLNDAAREVLAMCAGELQQRRVVLATDFADDLPAANGDRVQLQQVILNLVLNAADAMSDVEDRPRRLRLVTAREGSNHVGLSVQDSGVGIEPEKREQLFNAFYTTKSDGMGIGLAISRTIIENHDGQIWAEPSEDGAGATFSFCIPTQPAGRCGPPSRPEEAVLAR